ncbi:hypothetical protein GA0115246_112921, partial [Streptomyces sp. SolWspMP-sol7th]
MRRIVTLVAAATAALLLTGCVTVHPEAPRPGRRAPPPPLPPSP